MKTLIQAIIILSLSFFLTSCGSMPDVSLRYYLPKVSVNVTATQTAKCVEPVDEKGQHDKNGKYKVYVTSAVEFEDSYSANRDDKIPRLINLNDLDGYFSAGHFQIEFADDGLLTGIDSEFTSQATEALQVVRSIVDPTTLNNFENSSSVSVKDACELVSGLTFQH